MATSKTQYVVTLADGTEHTVQTTLEDKLAFETAVRKNKRWGKLEDNTLKLLPFLAWNALHRTGQTTLTWDEFTSGPTAALDVQPVEPDDESDDDAELEVEGVGKDTPTAPSTSSPSYSPATTAAPLGSGVPVTPAHA